MKNNKHILFTISLITIVLTIFSFSLVVTTYSRYITSSIDDEKGTVAQFKISEVLENGGSEQVLELSLIPGDRITENVLVTNDSNVTVKYTITITNITNNLPLEFTGYVGEIKYGPSETKICPIIINWPSELNDPSYSGKVDFIKISIVVEQVVEG